MSLLTNETKREKHNRRLEALKRVRQPREAEWTDLAQYTAPQRLRLSVNGQEQRLDRRKILDSSGTFYLRTLQSGMHSGITSPARPWFRLATLDPELRNYGPVKEYLSAVEITLRETFQQSNIYNAFHWGYGDLGLLGQSCGLLVEDDENAVRMIQMVHGRFWLARDEKGRANTLYRQLSWPVERIVGRFKYENCSAPVKNAYDRGDYDERFTINHAVEPRRDRDPAYSDKRNKPWCSNYWEDGGERLNGQMLEESGFDSNPIIAPPWELVADDHYGNSPGMDALPDVKMLQVEQRWKGEGIEKKIRPPMTAPTTMRNNPASSMPNSITYVDDPTGKGYRPAFEVDLPLGDLRNDINEVRGMIERAYYADLFLMLANMDGVQPRNQFEIAERKEEKLLALGPTLENIYGGQLAPVIDRTYDICERRGKLPPAPEEIQGKDLKIEYISILAQAQKAVSTGSVERLLSFVGNLAGGKPEILDKVDMDESVDVYADMIGAPPSIVVSDEKVKQMRDARAQQQQQAAAAESAAALAPAVKQSADAARVLAETDAGGGNLLQRIGIG